MTQVTRSLVEQLPKAELHCHLDGSVRPETLLELGREYGVAMPRDDAEALREYMIVRDHSTLEEYLARFQTTLSVMQKAEALERIAYELATDASREGVWYLETRFAPNLNTRGGLTPAQALEAAIKGLERAERDCGIIARVLVCAIRTLPRSSSIEMAHLAVDFHGRGVVGFDLAGAEHGNPASAHAEAFAYARQHDVPCTCHAGEGDGAASVRDAVHACCASRIGHGTRLIEDTELTEYVNDRRIAIEVCLTSNVQTRAAASIEDASTPGIPAARVERGAQHRQPAHERHDAGRRIRVGSKTLGRRVRRPRPYGIERVRERFPALGGSSGAGWRGLATKSIRLARDGVVTASAADVARQVSQRMKSNHRCWGSSSGRGLGGLANRIEKTGSIPYPAIPGFAACTVPGHSGRLIAGTLAGRPVVALAGTISRLRGHSAAETGVPDPRAHALGASTLLVSNAAAAFAARWCRAS
jgi:adenosine deaminase